MLIIPPWYFAHCTDNITEATPDSSPGSTVVAGANNADGSAVSAIAAIAHDVHYIVIGVSGYGLSNSNVQVLLDLLIDPAGGTSWSNFIDDLVCGQMGVLGAGGQPPGQWYHFPVYVKAGASLGFQSRTRHTATVSGVVQLYAYGCPSRPEAWWCGQKVESLGINAGTSQGTDVNPGTTAGTFGSWTTIGTTTARYGAVQLGINGADGSGAVGNYYWELGHNSQRLPGSPRFYNAHSNAETSARAGFCMPIFCDIPSGTVMQARGNGSLGATNETFNLAVYGVY